MIGDGAQVHKIVMKSMTSTIAHTKRASEPGKEGETKQGVGSLAVEVEVEVEDPRGNTTALSTHYWQG